MPEPLEQLIAALADSRLRIVDLTQTLAPSTPVIELPPQFAASPPCTIENLSRYDDKGPAWYWNSISLGEHTGTHFDAPIHWITGKDQNSCDTIPPQQFIAKACVLDMTDEVANNEDFLLEPSHIEQWEAKHGRIPKGAWVLFHSAWSNRTDAGFINARDDGPHSPGPSPAAVAMLANDRDILGFGTETIGTDAGQAANFDPPFPCHHLMHGAGKFGLASLCNLDQLHPTASLIIAAPLKIVQGSGSPLRALAITPA